MRWLYALWALSYLVWGCQEDETQVAEIVLVEAPTRLPFLENPWHPQPYETLAVRFVVKLEPPLEDVDSIVCRIRDEYGDQVDSFELFDDGSGVLHEGGSTCQLPHSGDVLSNDGFFARIIQTCEFASNWSGQEFSFDFSALHPSAKIVGATHTAHTWAPTVEISVIANPPGSFSFCDDTAYIEMHISRDSTDFIESVIIGYQTSYNGLGGIGLACTAVSGDTIWRGLIASTNSTWSEFGRGEILAELSTRLRQNWLVGLDYGLSLDPPSVDLSMNPDTIRMVEFGVPNDLTLMSEVLTCAEPRRSIFCGSEIFWTNSTPDIQIIVDNGMFSDCGTYGDLVGFDGIYARRIQIQSNGFSEPQLVEIRVKSGLGLQYLCYGIEDDFYSTRFDDIRIVVLPPL